MNYRNLTLIFLLCCACVFVTAQSKIEIATLNPEGNIAIKHSFMQKKKASSRSDYQQLENFPFRALAHPTFKNFRNVSIVDLNKDGMSEIVVCLNETLYCVQSDGTLLWSQELEGTSNFPPAIDDIDNDGNLDIALQTYGVPSAGNVYLFDQEGSIKEGWPLNFNDHFFLNGITLADLNSDGIKEIIASERISSNEGRIHALTTNGSSINTNWPVTVNGTPAITPSIADINNNGSPEIITTSTSVLYALDHLGDVLAGFPNVEPGTKFSYQSPLLADLNNDGNLEIVGARHGDKAGTYVLTHESEYFGNWPDYDNSWTFAAPAIADIDADGDHEIFYGRPYFSETELGAIVLGYDHEGNELDGFPIMGMAGSEGTLTIADIDADGDMELLTSSKAIEDGKGMIHAYHIENQQEVEDFPLLVEGFTFLNGAFLADINNDGILDLTALSYQSKFNPDSPDSAFVNVFNLEVPYDETSILFNGYKGSLDHTGAITKELTGLEELKLTSEISISPNPVHNWIRLDTELELAGSNYSIFSVDGELIKAGTLALSSINVEELKNGAYFLSIESKSKRQVVKFVMVK